MVPTRTRRSVLNLLVFDRSSAMSLISDDRLPPLASSGVFSVSGSSVIDSPREQVWPILLDFPSYRECRGTTVVDRDKQPLEDQTLAEGKYLHIAPVHLPPTLGEASGLQKQEAYVVVNVVDHENYHLKWTNIIGFPFLLKAQRWQALTIDDNGKTKYETFEVFSGVLAYVVKFFTQDKLNQGFIAMAQALKERAERRSE